jgi:hypothetical protein
MFNINQPKTWFIDLDGTLVVHNGYKNGQDVLLDGVSNFFNKISKNDFIIITTARDKKYKVQTIEFLKKNKIRFNKIIFNLPTGERILINDKKPDGTITAYSINVDRNSKMNIDYLQK